MATTALVGIVRLALLSEAAESNRHDLAVTPAGLGQVLAQGMAAHKAEADPHTQYYNAARLSDYLASRDGKDQAERFFYANF